MRLSLNISLLLLSILFAQCGNESKSSEISTSRKHLGRLINLEHYKPLRVKWRTVNLTKESFAPGPSDYKLEAELIFNPSDLKILKENYQLLSVSYLPYKQELYEFPWLTKKQKRRLNNHLGTVYHTNYFDATGYNNGSFIILDDRTILLVMIRR